jgi:LacI family gluconate utilization system Gnt-I transcriptional repressor
VPVVETFEFTPSPIDINVGFSNFEAGAAITRYLTKQGRRNLAFVEHSRIDDSRMNARREGFLAACAQAEIEDCRVFSIPSDPGTGIGGDVLAQILAEMPAADAVIFAGHQVAVGAVRFAVDNGIDVPGRLAITGFGDSPIAQWVRPALTTVRFPVRQMGAEAARLLLARMTGAPTDRKPVDLGFEILQRESA